MSSDTAKENSSVVDSLLTDCNQDMANMDTTESSSCRVDKDGSRIRLEESGHVDKRLLNTTICMKEKSYDTKYFIIKSINHENIQLSVKHGIWATQIKNEPILEKAFHESSKVILIFSVNLSHCFQGYAQMMSSARRWENIWRPGCGKTWGRSFEVKWLRLSDLPFQKTDHLKNPLNENQVVKISRDCQELTAEIGEALCELFNENSVADAATQRHTSESQVISARMEPPSSRQAEECGTHSAPLGWNNAPIFYPPMIYQRQVEASGFQFPPHYSAGFFAAKDIPIGVGPPGLARTMHSYLSGNRETAQGHKVSSRYENLGLPAEISLDSTLTEDDLLEMSYEEYLEAYSRGRVPFHLTQAAQATQRKQGSSRSRKQNDYDRARSHKRVRH